MPKCCCAPFVSVVKATSMFCIMLNGDWMAMIVSTCVLKMNTGKMSFTVCNHTEDELVLAFYNPKYLSL
jgi:hypothetical protein